MVELRNRTSLHNVLLFRSIDLCIHCRSNTLASCYHMAHSVCHVLNNVCLIRVINKPQQFHSYRTIWEYEPDQYQNPLFTSSLVLSILLKPYSQQIMQHLLIE